MQTFSIDKPYFTPSHLQTSKILIKQPNHSIQQYFSTIYYLILEMIPNHNRTKTNKYAIKSIFKSCEFNKQVQIYNK